MNTKPLAEREGLFLPFSGRTPQLNPAQVSAGGPFQFQPDIYDISCGFCPDVVALSRHCW